VMLPFLPLSAVFIGLGSPDSSMMQVLGLVPLTSMTVVPTRLVLGEVSLAYVGVSLALLLGATWLVRRGAALGAGEILLTSMDTDGTKAGYDLELTAAMVARVDVPVIASGGAGNLEHLHEAFTNGQAHAVLAASIFHYGEFGIGQAKQFLAERGLPMRMV
jgi:imidazole glycerol phosphate synthase subunit HisF